MNWDQVMGKWGQLTGTLREKWGKLTDDHFTEIAGRKDHLIGKVQEIYGLQREAAEKQWKPGARRSKTEPSGFFGSSLCRIDQTMGEIR